MNRKKLALLYITIVVCAIACAVTYAGKKCKLSQVCPFTAAKAAITALYPNAEIKKMDMEKESVKVFEAELLQNGQELEATLALDGTLMEVETEMTEQQLPEAVAKALEAAAEGATVNKLSKETTYAVIQVVKLDQPQTTYEAKMSKEGAKCKIELAADGTILNQSDWKMCEKNIAQKSKCSKADHHMDD